MDKLYQEYGKAMVQLEIWQNIVNDIKIRIQKEINRSTTSIAVKEEPKPEIAKEEPKSEVVQ